MKIILISIVLSCVAYSVYGLQCYNCTNTSGSNCNGTSVNCTSGQVCTKLDYSDTNTTKGCGASNFCDQYDSIDDYECNTCDEDNCNSATSTRLSLLGASLIGYIILKNIL